MKKTYTYILNMFYFFILSFNYLKALKQNINLNRIMIGGNVLEIVGIWVRGLRTEPGDKHGEQ